jgi:hypothetical protein
VRFATCATGRLAGHPGVVSDGSADLLCRDCGSRRCAYCRPDSRQPASASGSRSRGRAATLVSADVAPGLDELGERSGADDGRLLNQLRSGSLSLRTADGADAVSLRFFDAIGVRSSPVAPASLSPIVQSATLRFHFWYALTEQKCRETTAPPARVSAVPTRSFAQPRFVKKGGKRCCLRRGGQAGLPAPGRMMVPPSTGSAARDERSRYFSLGGVRRLAR